MSYKQCGSSKKEIQKLLKKIDLNFEFFIILFYDHNAIRGFSG